MIVGFSSISCKKDNPVAPPPTADFNITLQAVGHLVYSSGIIIGVNYLVKATLKELTGVGAQILSVKTTFVDSYGNSYTFNYTGVEFFFGRLYFR